MKTKILFSLIVAGSVALSSMAFAQIVSMTGTVKAVTTSTITVQRTTGEVWDIARTSTTQVTSGELKVGSMVTVSYNAPDAQKKETPAVTPTPSAAGD
jgi:hypothetical protein